MSTVTHPSYGLSRARRLRRVFELGGVMGGWGELVSSSTIGGPYILLLPIVASRPNGVGCGIGIVLSAVSCP